MRREGFTLVEIIIVVALIGLLAIALLPRVGGGSARALAQSAQIVESNLRYAGQRAIATGRLHRWTLDLDQQAFRLEVAHAPPDTEEAELPTHAGLLDLAPPQSEIAFEPVENRTGEWRWLDDDGILLDGLRIGDEEYLEGVVSIAFAGDGGAEPAEVRLSDSYGYQVGVHVSAFTGEVRRGEEERQ